MSSIGQRVRKLREEWKMSAAELARAIGVKQPSIFDIESGRTKSLRANTLVRLVEELHTTADYLLWGETGPGGLELGRMEAELTYTVRSLSPERRLALMEFARHLLGQQPPGSRPAEQPSATVSKIRGRRGNHKQ